MDYDGSFCRHCGGTIDDPFELTGMLDDQNKKRLYPLTLIGTKGAMTATFLHKSCISGYFKYLAESSLGDLCREQQDFAEDAVALNVAGLRVQQRL